MALFKGKKQTRTAIIIKDHVIRFVHAKRPDLLAIHSFGERYLPQGIIRNGKIIEKETLEGILQDFIEEWKLKKQFVQFLVPNEFTILRTIQIPLTVKKDEIKGYLYTILGETVHLPYDNPAFDVHDLGEREGQRDILLIAAPENIVDQFYDLMQAVKVKPNAADISALSIFRLFHSLDRDNKGDHFLFVQLDILSINISIFHDQKPVFMRHMKLTTDEDKWKASIDPTEGMVWQGDHEELEGQVQDVVSEIEKIMTFYRFSIHQGKLGVTRIILTGDHPYLENVIERCSSSLDLPVETITEEEIYTTNGKQIPIRFHDAVGLVLKKEVYDVS